MHMNNQLWIPKRSHLRKEHVEMNHKLPTNAQNACPARTLEKNLKEAKKTANEREVKVPRGMSSLKKGVVKEISRVSMCERPHISVVNIVP